MLTNNKNPVLVRTSKKATRNLIQCPVKNKEIGLLKARKVLQFPLTYHVYWNRKNSLWEDVKDKPKLKTNQDKSCYKEFSGLLAYPSEVQFVFQAEI